MRLLFACFFIFLTNNLFAQQNGDIIYRDTINLRGYIYDNIGKPVKYMVIESKQQYVGSNAHITVLTDTNGFFKLDGIKYNDTLKLGNIVIYEPIPLIYNRGSRYMTIYLTPKINNINPKTTVQISAKRKYPKKIPSFIVKYKDGNYEPITDVNLIADFNSRKETFEEYINRNVKYPETAINSNIEGMVRIGFTIERNGSLTHFKILNGIGYGCDEAVADVIKNSPMWRPAIQLGRPIVSEASVSVEFKLTDK
jgi:TonB family protein